MTRDLTCDISLNNRLTTNIFTVTRHTRTVCGQTVSNGSGHCPVTNSLITRRISTESTPPGQQPSTTIYPYGIQWCCQSWISASCRGVPRQRGGQKAESRAWTDVTRVSPPNNPSPPTRSGVWTEENCQQFCRKTATFESVSVLGRE